MNIKTQYLKSAKEWTAFVTIMGLDINEYGTLYLVIVFAVKRMIELW